MKLELTVAGKVEEYLEEKKYSEALRILDKIDRNTLSGDIYGQYCILYANASLAPGNLSDSKREVIKELLFDAIEHFRGSTDTSSFAWTKFWYGCF